MNINSPMAFIGPWTLHFGFGRHKFSTPHTRWTKDPAKLLAGFAFYYTAQGKRESVVVESEGWANVIWHRIAVSGVGGTTT